MRRPDLVPDCSSCSGLCCIATSFERSDEFALTKPFGVRCPHLEAGCRCAIHAELAVRGFVGCTLFDCYGAGPRVTREIAAAPESAARRDEAFLVLRELHELMWLMGEALAICPPGEIELRAGLAAAIEAIELAATAPLPRVADLDPSPARDASRALLRGVGRALGGRGEAGRRSLRVLQ